MCGFPLGFRFDYADSFSEGLARVSVGGKTGFIDKSGNFIINPVFNQEGSYSFGRDSLLGFSEGLAVVSTGEYPSRQYGCIDRSGNYVIRPQFSCLWHFSEGLAPFRQNGKWGFVDRAGSIVVKPVYDKARFFSEGLAAVKKGPGEYEYIDTSGSVAIRKTRNLVFDMDEDYFLCRRKLSRALDFHEGYARAGYGVKEGLIDRSGYYRQTKDDIIGDFSEGLVPFKRGNPVIGYRCGFLDKEMNVVIEPAYTWACEFVEGFASVMIDRQVGFVNTAGALVVPCRFHNAAPFHEGFAAVEIDGKYGYVDSAGDLVITPQFDSARNFSEGLAAVRKNRFWGFIDKTGELVF
jgi:hypothetical protein